MKKGFTLIELLAVIVILAIIALIATPIVLNIIDDTKDNAVLRSADFYLAAVDNSIATAILNEQKIEDGVYPIMEDGNICLGNYSENVCTENKLIVEVNGEVPTAGFIKIEKREVKEVIDAPLANHYLNFTEEDGITLTQEKKQILITSLKIKYPYGDNNLKTMLPTITIEPSDATNKELIFTMGDNYYDHCDDKIKGSIAGKATLNSSTGELTRTFNSTDAVVLITATTTDGSNISATYEAPLGNQYICGAW
jgi:prepilin-type N-terminal cleavage/methylation domain-containing protein